MSRNDGTSRLSAWRSRGRGPLRWIDIDGYAHRVFAGSRPDWWTDATAHAAALIQANAVLRSHILALPAAVPFLEAGGPLDGTATGLTDRLRAGSPAAFLDSAADALAHGLGHGVDLMLALPCPRDLLRAAGADPDDLDAQDEVALCLTDVLRALSDKPLGGLLLCFADPPDGDAVTVCETLTHTARHYGWSVAVSLDHATDPAEAAAARALAPDAILLPEVPAAAIVATGEPDLGGGLTRRFWAGEDGIPETLSLLHGRPPADADPETVLRRLAALP
ncbi:hypothetical protein HL658_26615 [Azospirillum sp. RWY-5-1]|uniref:Uncharacterized protein n=1 Tax=Azospirillum oleiclasticum TaxID=2735135 RepID=A0ABX2TF95_9PROT|nr:hypothetical protein [Azospirillum oleiclasticum]NYZ16129.1 hypothetical protein [Azospirillum oleiclasticum]NYZ23010.1 hypothetical protein [Azospirillum oleiclasticum]